MKKLLLLILILINFNCSKQDEPTTPKTIYTYQFSTNELELLNNINLYRDSIGLNTLQTNQHISYICKVHNIYMIETGNINHDYFQHRVNNLQETLDATRVGENIAYNYSTPNSTLNAWLGSPGHKQNIEGNYTDFGLSITIGTNQRKYITLILIKK